MNYKDTINLPKTKFKMKANLDQLEPAMQKRWDKMDLYRVIREARAGATKFTLHDGPPYPTGDLHIGTGLNKILKDFIVRYRTMCGDDAPYVPGWDCHGLPIEWKVLQELGAARETLSKAEIRKKCRNYALKYVKAQKKQFKSLGVNGDWDDPYLTILPGYEAGIMEVFAEMVGKGFIYRDLKPIHWCYNCSTALAEAELEYEDVTGPSVYVNFPVTSNVSDMFDVTPEDEVNILIWTTTPWTLPANLAVAVLPSADYVAVRYAHPDTGTRTVSILAKALVEQVMETAGVADFEVVGQATGQQLTSLTYRHWFLDRQSPVLPAQYVTLTDGTGCVHTAPGHGQEDYITGMNHGLEILSPVDANGHLDERAGQFNGLHIDEGSKAIVEFLVEEGHMLHGAEATHSYPHCWRCHHPVIFRATNQWFVRIDHDGFREQALEAVKTTRWVPGWGQERIRSMITDRPDWCISRQRTWGVPIPAFYCRACGDVLLTKEVTLNVAKVFEERGADSWFRTDDATEFLPEGTTCTCGACDFEKETDILDVWFESGSSHNSVVRRRPELSFPADVYLEGVDQYRGWFQLSLLPSLAAWGQAPFKTVVIHGFVVDDQGKKMSKSLGNFISVSDGVKDFRADILRLWCSSVDYHDQMSVSPEAFKQGMADSYRRIRNTFRFLLGNIADFDPAQHSVPLAEMPEIDRWALDALARLVQTVQRGWDDFEIRKVYTPILMFCSQVLSGAYLDVTKDRVYCSAADWKARRSAQTVMHQMLLALTKLVAPILVHTAEQVWDHIEHPDEDVPSVHLASFPQPPAEWLDDALHTRWQRLLAVRDDVARAIEALREEKIVSQSMEVNVTLATTDADLLALLTAHEADLHELILVSDLTILDAVPTDAEMAPGKGEPTLLIQAVPSTHPKCVRCWNLRSSVGQSAEHPELCARCVKAVGG